MGHQPEDQLRPVERVRPRLLLVEGDPATTKAIRSILDRQGWEVSTAATLADAWPILESIPDVLSLDLMLPDVDGPTRLGAGRERNLPVRIVVTTGTGGPARLAAVRRPNPDSLLFKPVDLTEFLQALGNE